MEKIKIENRKYRELKCSGKVFNNYTFTDCAFETVDFSQCTFVNCTFVNCAFDGHVNDSFFCNCDFENCRLGSVKASQFISCSFSSCGIFGLYDSDLLDCQFSDAFFDGNYLVLGNTFDRVRGNIKFDRCLGVYKNIFKDMDFSGFLDFYFRESCIDLVQNSFINTTISTDAIMKLARKADCLGTTFRSERGNLSSFYNIPVGLNMRNLSDEEKFGLVANAFLRLVKVDEEVLSMDDETMNLKSHFHLFSFDNDKAPIIIGKDGRVLKPDAIPKIDMGIDVCQVVRSLSSFLFKVDGETGKYGVDINDDRVYEPSKRYFKS